MLTPTVIATKKLFYAIGNTTAQCVTRHLPQGVDVDVLLLGCGDVRHVLFTAYSEQGFPSRKIDVTCCDYQDHIVARNALFLSLLCRKWDQGDKISVETLWNIYYHRYLSASDMQRIQSHVRELLEMSTSLQTWHAGRYGATVRFCDQATLDSVRAIWTQYDEAVSAKDSEAYKQAFNRGMAKSTQYKDETYGSAADSYMAPRSNAPLQMVTGAALLASMGDIWKTGQTSTDTPPPYPNPLIGTALSDGVPLAFPANPLIGFHLATACMNLSQFSPLHPGKPVDADTRSWSNLVAAAKIQFAHWVKAYRASAPNLVVRFTAADCFAFCQTLQHNLVTGETTANLYRRQLDTRPLALDDAEYGKSGSGPRKFDAIDTSNLCDHTGTLNLLVSAGLLLKDNPSSILYTDSMAMGSDSKEAVATVLCGRTKTMSLLLGLAPIEYWTNATSVSPTDELMLKIIEKSDGDKWNPGLQVRHAWKPDSRMSENASPTPLSVDPATLAKILLKVYEHMFKHEKITSLYSGKQTAELMAYPQHHRGSFAAVVKAVCSRVCTDAQEVARQVIRLINSDMSLMIGNNYGQSLSVEFSKFGLYSEPWLTREIRRDPSKGTFCNWQDIPEAVAVTVVIPPSRWKPVFEEGLANRAGLMFEGQVRSIGRWHNLYADVHLAFGTLTASGTRTNDEYSVSVEEDSRGMAGGSSLIASFYVSAAALQVDMDTSLVALCLQNTIQNMQLFRRMLGVPMCVFETKLQDTEHVFVTKYPPGQLGPPLVRSKEPSPVELPETTLTPEFDASWGGLAGITGRLNVLSEEGKRLLQEEKVAVTLEQTSPYTIDVIFGKRSLVQTLIYRVPVTSENTKTRTARKSSYVEVVATLAEPGVSSILEDYIYPTVLSPSSSPASPVSTLNITHLNLDTLPIIDVTDKPKLYFLNLLTSFTFSHRERQMREAAQASDDPLTSSARLNFKESIFTMFMLSSGLQGGHTGLFAIDHPGQGGLHMLIFVSAIRLDGPNCSVVLDAAVIPFTTAHLADEDLKSFLLLLRTLEACTITVNDAELTLWKRVLPALAERCRTWSHLPTCEYATEQSVPVSLAFGEKVLCSCGRGKISPTFVGIPDWEEVAAQHATRIAISPTYALPYVEPLVDEKMADDYKKNFLARAMGGSSDVCMNCRRTEGKGGGPLKKCMRCLKVKYCSAECQKKDWRKHRMECKESEVYGMD